MVLVIGLVVLLTEFMQCRTRHLSIEIPVLDGEVLAVATQVYVLLSRKS